MVGDYQEQQRKQRIMLVSPPTMVAAPKSLVELNVALFARMFFLIKRCKWSWIIWTSQRLDLTFFLHWLRWDAWKRTDSKARQGKGFNPNLDKCFLEFLVSTEIDSHSYAHDVEPVVPLERCQRNFEKVRRVAQIRIGQERLEAYRARVKEAFFAYIEGCQNWTTWDASSASGSFESSSTREAREDTEVDKIADRARGRDEKRARRDKRSRGKFRKRRDRFRSPIVLNLVFIPKKNALPCTLPLRLTLVHLSRHQTRQVQITLGFVVRLTWMSMTKEVPQWTSW
jgi:hypothetical protein